MKTRIIAVAAASAALLALAIPGEVQARPGVQLGVGNGSFYLNVQPQQRYYGNSYGNGYQPYYNNAPAYYDNGYYEEPYYYENYGYRHKRKKIYDDHH